MKLAILISSLLALTHSSCVHMRSKSEMIKKIKRWQRKQDHLLLQEEGAVVKVLRRDPKFQQVDEVYEFGEDGEQLKYSIIANCDSCFQKYLANTLKNNSYQWKQLNDSTYLSKYALSRVLNIHPSRFTFDIVKHESSRLEYQVMLKRAKKQ